MCISAFKEAKKVEKTKHEIERKRVKGSACLEYAKGNFT